MFNVVLIFFLLLGQHRTGKSLKQFCLRGSSQQYIGKNLVQCCLNTISMVKTLCYVAQEAPDNIVQEKIFCSVVLVLLEQHCTGKTLWNVVFEAPDKLNYLGKTLHS